MYLHEQYNCAELRCSGYHEHNKPNHACFGNSTQPDPESIPVMQRLESFYDSVMVFASITVTKIHINQQSTLHQALGKCIINCSTMLGLCESLPDGCTVSVVYVMPNPTSLKGTNPALKKPSNIPEIYAKMFGRFH